MLVFTVPYLLKVDKTLSILRGLTLVYMAISSRDIVVLKRMMIHWISSEIGFPILVERHRGSCCDARDGRCC